MECNLETPQVSVIMPCYNHAGFLRESIESVLGQSYGDLELIITDDCSRDNSMEVIENYRRLDKRIIAIHHERNMGEAKSRNDALAVCRGDHIGFCDADDVWEKDKLRIQIALLQKGRGNDVIHSDSNIINENSIRTGERFSSNYQKGRQLSGDLFQELCDSNFINIPTVLLPKESVKDAGLFEEDFKYLTDWIYWVKVARHYKFFYIDEPLARYRVHEGSTKKDIKGYSECRIKGYSLILNRFPDIPMKIKSRIYYELGINHNALKAKAEARKYFLESFRMDKSNLKSFLRFVQINVH
jgi:glycosyltransferase involved in cell wall biosynthesis